MAGKHDEESAALARQIGRAIRTARTDSGLTLQVLADKTQMSQPFLSQLENGRSMPSIMTVHKIAQALGTTAQALLAPSEGDMIQVTRREEGSRLELAPGVTVRFLVNRPGRMEPNEVTAAPETDQGSHIEHAGEEFIYLLDGKLDVNVGTKEEHLEAGDSICYPATVPHGWVCASEQPARFLIVSSPASF